MLRSLRIENFVLIREAELELGPGLNAVTGETGAGKTILAQALGLLLGAKGDAGYVGPGASEAYVEAELDLPEGVLEDEALAVLRDFRPADEERLVAARRVFADGRTRAYAWGRSVAREDLALLVDRLLAMSGQFEQRRLARASFQLDLLDSYSGDDQLRLRAEHVRAWRELQAARRRRDDLAAAAATRESRIAELRELAARTEGLEADTEEQLLAERLRVRHAADLATAAAAAAEAVAPENGEGAAELAARAGRALESVTALAPELASVAEELTDVEVRLRESASTLRSYLDRLEPDPGRVDAIESELDRIAEAKRRFRATDYAELLAAAVAARTELENVDAGADPLAAAESRLAEAEQRTRALASELSQERVEAAPRFAAEVSAALAGLAMGEGEFRVDVEPREPAASGADDITFRVRPNAGLPFAPVAETASGGELSRIALALRTVAHAGAGEPTIVFDEIDAGIGGRTAHAVADALRDLAGRAQVVTITHLPQIASAADVHFRVEKVPGDPTHTRIARLSDAGRKDELERMLGGAEFLSGLR
ncbi:MAG TPA: AAA family ATPase [Gaiellaceae bacterium]|nr:AAA family ATPase [Gaiellaceae bacterium]